MLYLYQNVLMQLQSNAEGTREECCGFLCGHEMDQVRVITTVIPVKNVSPANRESTFEISAQDYMHAENLASDNNLKLLGIYHSHPNGSAVPSEFDRIAAQPYFSYLIVSVMKGKTHAIRSWNLSDANLFEEEPLSIIHINHQDIHGYRNHPNTAA